MNIIMYVGVGIHMQNIKYYKLNKNHFNSMYEMYT